MFTSSLPSPSNQVKNKTIFYFWCAGLLFFSLSLLFLCMSVLALSCLSRQEGEEDVVGGAGVPVGGGEDKEAHVHDPSARVKQLSRILCQMHKRLE